MARADVMVPWQKDIAGAPKSARVCVCARAMLRREGTCPRHMPYVYDSEKKGTKTENDGNGYREWRV